MTINSGCTGPCKLESIIFLHQLMVSGNSPNRPSAKFCMLTHWCKMTLVMFAALHTWLPITSQFLIEDWCSICIHYYNNHATRLFEERPSYPSWDRVCRSKGIILTSCSWLTSNFLIKFNPWGRQFIPDSSEGLGTIFWKYDYRVDSPNMFQKERKCHF